MTDEAIRRQERRRVASEVFTILINEWDDRARYLDITGRPDAAAELEQVVAALRGAYIDVTGGPRPGAGPHGGQFRQFWDTDTGKEERR